MKSVTENKNFAYLKSEAIIRKDYHKNDRTYSNRTIVVEGKSDKDVYQCLFSRDNCPNIKIPDDSERMRARTQPGHIPSVGVAWVQQYLDRFRSSYGFVDFDYGQNNPTEIQNLITTAEHDLETNLIWCYFDQYIQSLKLDDDTFDKMLDVLHKSLTLTTKQGILGKTSFEFGSKPYGQAEKKPLQQACHYFFKDFKDLKQDGFDFEEYLQDVMNKNQNFKRHCEQFGMAENVDFENLKNQLERWLKKQESLSEPESENIQKCLQLSNGHMLIGHLVYYGASYFKIPVFALNSVPQGTKPFAEEEKYLRSKLTQCAIDDKSAIYKIDPLKSFTKLTSSQGKDPLCPTSPF